MHELLIFLINLRKISTDVECSEWRSQEWLFNSANSKILSVQEVGKCLGYSTDFYLIGCDDSNSTSPINSATLIPGSDYDIGSTTLLLIKKNISDFLSKLHFSE